MTKKLIYLIRHGETEFNRIGIVQGSGVDSDLNETGRNQALAFYQYYKNVPFQKVYTSALKRTHQTVVHFTENGLPSEEIAELNEISWGEKEGRIPNAIDNKYYADLLEDWQNGNTFNAAIGGESPEFVAERQKIGLKKILENTHESLILIAMHGRAMRILLSQIMGLPLSAMDTFQHQNTCLYRLEYDYETQKFEMLSSNDVQHFSLLPETKQNVLL